MTKILTKIVTTIRPLLPGGCRGLRLYGTGMGAALMLLLSGFVAPARAAAPPSPPAAAPAAAPTPGAAPASTAGGPGAKPATAAPAAAAPVPAPSTLEPPAPQGDLGAAVIASPEPPAVPRVVPTADTADTESDHDAVAGAWGIEVRPVAATLPVFGRRASTGCPTTTATSTTTGTTATSTVDCPPVLVSALSVRHWLGRNLAINAGLAFALGGGSDGSRLLDSYFGIGPVVGVSVLLGNWRHLAIAASPELAFVMFKAAGSADSTYLTDLRAVLEAELHFGFIGVPALSLGIRSGLLLRIEHAADVTLWSVGVAGATSLKGIVSDVSLRYYF